MLRNLGQIFPEGYPNIPTIEELEIEVREMLCHCDNAQTVLHYIHLIECPYYQEAIAQQTEIAWHNMERERKEPAVYCDMEGAWHYSWVDIDSAMHMIIKKAHAMQIEMEQQLETEACVKEEVPCVEDNSPAQSSLPDTPSFKIRYADVVYANCTIYQYATEAPKEEERPSLAKKVETAAPLYPSFFRTDAQSITVIQKTFEEAMAMSVKTKCIRFLLKHSRRDGCFNFSDMTNEQRAAALNSVQDKHHFTAGDFENACHISRKK
jgi:hypothetical protein